LNKAFAELDWAVASMDWGHSPVFLLFALLFEKQFVSLSIVVLEPWFILCTALTPEAWQTKGNILLGLSWMFSGVIVYAGLLGAVCVAFLSMVEKLRVPNKALEERS
jgi:hypothetical protein